MSSSLKELLFILSLCVVMALGTFVGAKGVMDDYSHLLQVSFGDLKSMKKECEKSLPRDKFCTLKVSVVEEK